MATVIAIANQKGGVGKTTIAVQLAYDLALRMHHKVLYVDMDAQGNGSAVLLAKDPITGTQATELFTPGNRDIQPQKTKRGIDLLPTESNSRLSYSLEALPEEFIGVPAENLKPLAERYDTVIIDCPPNLGVKLTAGLTAATHVLCPIRLCGFSLDGLSGLLDTIFTVQRTRNPMLNIIGTIVNAFDRSVRHTATLEELKAMIPNLVLQNVVRNRAPFDKANMDSCPVWEIPGGKRATEELRLAFEEIYKRAGITAKPAPEAEDNDKAEKKGGK